MMVSRLTRWCDGVIEAGWLLAVIVAPLFFNIHSDRVFEPDKITFVRSLALIMSLAWLVKFSAQQGWHQLRAWPWRGPEAVWRMPFVLPVLSVVVVYLLSSLFSIVPHVSWAGSYQRLQGTYSTLSYIVLFALIAATLRSRAQLQRLILTIILSSIPVALYGLLQWRQLDPLPWGGDTSTRVAGHMGNSIFVGAYLIMVFPLTAVRVVEAFGRILTDEELAYADVTRATIYIFTGAIQLFTLFRTQSRGPALGLAVGLFAFVLILLVGLRNAAERREGRPASTLLWPAVYMALGLGALAVSALLQPQLGAAGAFLLFAGVLSLLALSIFVLAAARRGQRWLWGAWLSLAALVGLVLVLFNVAGEGGGNVRTPVAREVMQTLDAWRDLPVIGRLGSLLEDDLRTGKVRVLIWTGALELIQPHDPIRYPDGEPDRFNFLRPLLGYGPEAMYVAYNSFYPPELATVEARNASPDRSHNETFDALVITGVLGFVVWQAVYFSIFYYGFRWLGIVRNRFEARLLLGLWIAGALVTLAFFVWWKGWVYLGVAIPFGSIFLGLIPYLIYYALRPRPAVSQESSLSPSDQLLLMGLVSALTAFYVEIHFGIAIAATRVHSFVYMGLLFIVGYWFVRAGDEPTPAVETPPPTPTTRRRRAAPASTPITPPAGPLGPLTVYALLLAVITGLLFFEFITFTPRPGELENIQSVTDLPGMVEIFHRAVLVNPSQNFADSPYIFGLVLVSWLLAVGLLVSESLREGVINGGSLYPGAAIPSVVSATAVLGLAALATGVVALVHPERSANHVLGGALLALWGVLTVGAALFLWLRPQEHLAHAWVQVAAGLSLLISLAALVAGALVVGLVGLVLAGALIYLGRDQGWNQLAAPLVWVGGVSFFLATVLALNQAALFRNSFITPPAAAQLEEAARRVLEANQITLYLDLLYLFMGGCLLALAMALTASSLSWRQVLVWLSLPLLLALMLLLFFLNDAGQVQRVTLLTLALMLAVGGAFATLSYRKKDQWRSLTVWGGMGVLVLLALVVLLVLDRGTLQVVGAVAFLTTLAIWFLAGSHTYDPLPAGPTVAWAILPVVALLGLYLVSQTNMRVVQADMVYKRARPFDNEASRATRLYLDASLPNQERIAARAASLTARDNAIAIYERAIEMTPREDFYYLWLGRAFLEKTTAAPDDIEALLQTAEERLQEAQTINPLNTDHTANLARLNVRWAGLSTDDPNALQERIEIAEAYYQSALTLSPHNAVIRNEYGGLLLTLAQDCERALAIFEESNAIDPFYTGTYYSLADAYVNCAPEDDLEQALRYLERATEALEAGLVAPTDKGQTRAEVRNSVARLHVAVGRRYLELGLFDQAEAAVTHARATQTDNNTVLALISQLEQEIDAARQG